MYTYMYIYICVESIYIYMHIHICIKEPQTLSLDLGSHLTSRAQSAVTAKP